MNYNSCAIEVNKKCILSCAHCCQDYKYGYEYISFSYFKKMIDEICKCDRIKAICLTGGEPFSNTDILIKYFEILANTGRYLTLVTSGLRANNYDFTYSLLIKLNKLGLKMITISVDEFHYKFVKSQNLINLLKVCNKLNIKSEVQIAIINSSNLSENINPIKKYLARSNIRVFPVYPIGRASIIQKEEIINYNLYDNLKCGKGYSFEIEYDGSVNPCCSPYAKYIDLHLGNIYHDSIFKIFKNLENHLILLYLRNKGFRPFIKIAESKGIAYPDRVTSSCELCYYLFSDNKYLDYILSLNDYLTKEK